MSTEHFPTIGADAEQIRQPADTWLIDLRATIDLTPQDEAFLQRLDQLDPDRSVLSARQQIRQIYLDGGDRDIIEQQFDVLKNVLGH
jgi:hypothetical protein